jgi:hypothetical protein
MVASLADANGRPLPEKTVIFVVSGPNGSASAAAITDFAGQASLVNLPLPPGSYTVSAVFGAPVTLHTGEVLDLADERYSASSASGELVLSSPLDCSTAQPSRTWIWPPNNELTPVSILGVTEAGSSTPVAITITSIFQDEPVGTGVHSPDGMGVGTSTAQVRAERRGGGDGRVYHIGFTAAGASGSACSGVIRVGVSANQGQGIEPIDDGPLYDSTVPGPEK